MDAVAGINDRILQIQSRIAELGAPLARTGAVRPPVAQVGTSTVGSSTVGSSASGTPTMGFSTSGAAFDSVLAQALGTVSGAGGTTPSTDAVGSGRSLVDAKGIPVELLAYGNGKVPADALSPVGDTGHRLWSPAARSLEALRDAAARDGVTVGITDSYRPYATQVDLVERKGLYSQGGLAARPGTSNHGWGIAVDLRLDSAAQSWMRANAGDYGFVEDVPREPWHWTYRPTR